MAEALGSEHPAYIATLYNLALSYDSIGDWVNAAKLYTQSVELYLKHRGPGHQDTHIVLHNVSTFMAQNGDYESELKYLKIVAEGSEATYGLANENTLRSLAYVRKLV